jgi:predicted Zn-dependent protease
VIGTVKERKSRQPQLRSSHLPLIKLFWLSAIPLWGIAAFASEFSGSLEIEPQSSFSRLKITLDHSFQPVIVDSPKGFRIEVPAATLMDVGIPFGSETAFNEYLKGVRDERLEHLRVRELEAKLVIEGDYRFPSGEKAFANPRMEHFDFRKDDQGKFVVDFFYKKGPTKAELDQAKKAELARQERARIEELRKRELARKQSRERRIQDGRNALLFCEQPLSRENNVFLKMKPEHESLRLGSYFPEKIPDHRFEYSEPKEKTEEADMVRLALKLSRSNSHALVIKTVDFLEKEYPKSKYLAEMRFLVANAYYRMGLEDQGKAIVQDLAKKEKGTPVGLQTAGFLAAQNFKNQQWLAALDAFLTLRKEMPKHEWVWLFRYGAAESLYQIKQGEQAREEYEWLSKNAPKPELRAEAAFKSGDYLFDRGQYAQAVTVYQAAVRAHESFLSRYPSVLLNLAESYFQLEELDRAEKEFKRYLEYGSAQPVAWRAGLRLAEITAIREGMNAKAEKAFLDTVNRFPVSQGALVSRIRMLPCGTHGGFDLPAAERLIASNEVMNFPSDGPVYPSQFRELAALTEVRTLLAFHEHQKAIDRGQARLRENPSVETRRLIEQAMISAIKSILEKKLNDGDVFGAIAFYEKHGDYLPLPAHDPLSDDLKIRLAGAAAEKNLSRFALKLIEPYRRMNDASRKAAIEAIEKHVALEGVEEQEERSLVEAKTLWNSSDFDIEDEEMGNRLVARLEFIRETSPRALEKHLILALFYREKEEVSKALAQAKAFGPLTSRLNSLQKAQVWSLAGELGNRASDPEFASKSFREARAALAQSKGKEGEGLSYRQLSAAPSESSLVKGEGEALEKQEKWKEAVALYSQAVENKIGGNHILYAHAKAILKNGGKDSRRSARVSLQKIEQSQDDDVWKRLAQETLKEIAKEGNDDKRNP